MSNTSSAAKMALSAVAAKPTTRLLPAAATSNSRNTPANWAPVRPNGSTPGTRTTPLTSTLNDRTPAPAQYTSSNVARTR
jgi:hypothetical protein